MFGRQSFKYMIFADALKSRDFFLEMMEMNEAVTDTDNLNELQKMYSDIEKRIDSLGEQFKTSFESNDMPSAKEIVLKLTFYYRLKANIDKKITLNDVQLSSSNND